VSETTVECGQCHEHRPPDEFLTKSGESREWCVRCRRLWIAKKYGIRCLDCDEPFPRVSKRDKFCETCRDKRRNAPVPKSETKPGSLLNPAIDPGSERAWRETQRRWAEVHGAKTW